MNDQPRIGTRSDVIVILTGFSFFLAGTLLKPSVRPSISLSWLLMMAGAGCGFVVIERAMGHGWQTSLTRSILLTLAIGISGIIGYFIESTWGPLRINLWWSLVVLALWSATTAGVYRLEMLVFERLRGRGPPDNEHG